MKRQFYLDLLLFVLYVSAFIGTFFQKGAYVSLLLIVVDYIAFWQIYIFKGFSDKPSPLGSGYNIIRQVQMTLSGAYIYGYILVLAYGIPLYVLPLKIIGIFLMAFQAAITVTYFSESPDPPTATPAPTSTPLLSFKMEPYDPLDTSFC